MYPILSSSAARKLQPQANWALRWRPCCQLLSALSSSERLTLGGIASPECRMGKTTQEKNENKGLPKQVKTQSKSIHMIPKDSIHCVTCDWQKILFLLWKNYRKVWGIPQRNVYIKKTSSGPSGEFSSTPPVMPTPLHCVVLMQAPFSQASGAARSYHSWGFMDLRSPKYGSLLYFIICPFMGMYFDVF